MRCFSVHAIYALSIICQLGSCVGANPTRHPSELIFRAGIIHSNTFKDFFDGLRVALQEIALRDNVTLSFQVEEIGEDYEGTLSLIGPDCLDGETRIVNNRTYGCSAFDFLIGDFWPQPDRYEHYDFTPAYLTTSLSALKYTMKTLSPDITSLTDASRTRSVICGVGDSLFVEGFVLKNFPGATVEPCQGEDPVQTCLRQLEKEECSLFVADELVLRKIQSDESKFRLTGEQFMKQNLAWPVRKDLDPTKAFLLNKWIYAALSSQAIDNLFVSMQVPEVLNMIPNDIKYTAYAMFGLNASAIFLCAAWLYNHWWSPQVRFSQPNLLLLVLLGCMFSSSTIIAISQENEGEGPVKACIAIPWLYSLGFSITFGALFAKIRRIYSIFNQQCERPVSDTLTSSFRVRGNISAKETLFTIGGVLLLDFTVLALWTALDPLHWERFTTLEDQFGDPLESQGYCTSDHWEPFFGMLVIIHISLVALATYMCYKARGIPTQYSEHKYVTVAMGSNLQLFMLGIPLLLIASTDPGAHFFVRSAVIWMNDLMIISLIFGNLMIKVYKSNAALNMDKVQGAINGIQRRRSAEHARRMSFGDSERGDSFVQRRNSGGHATRRNSGGNIPRRNSGGHIPRRNSFGHTTRRPSLGNADRFNPLGDSDRSSPAVMQKVIESGSTGLSSIDLESHEEPSTEIDQEPETPKDDRQSKNNESFLSEMSLSGFELSESSEDDHNGSSDSSRWRTSLGLGQKQLLLTHSHGDVPMMPMRDQTIVEELEEDGDNEDYSSSTDHDETMSQGQDGPVGIRMELPSIQELCSEDRYRASTCSTQPPFMPFRSPSKEEYTSRTESPSSYASTSSIKLSPKSLSNLRREALLSPSQTETAPNKPMRLESEHETIDNSWRTRKDDLSASDTPNNPHQAPTQPLRFLSEEEEIESVKEFRIPYLES
ncbi:unnamed protein product [Cylindrotheca closterium]|uniref:G-protein coupled receptors family 3 profile domain-containing protein n=1 Tax=Cylindrotheca closterium TaxID=2856 RepID=A0AAD2CC08_9STRA|nr:unnamed protein product [Cylindrotheca closterium]